jgi:hypothetical protein
MVSDIVVSIPKHSFYTLYAEGASCGITDTGDTFKVSFSPSGTIILFYTFPHHRRLYAVRRESTAGIRKQFIDCVEPLFSLFQLRGRAFDRFKRALEYIKKTAGARCFDYPSLFWFQLACLCREDKNSLLNISILMHRYDPDNPQFIRQESYSWTD